jgi:hypothetical protein
VNRDGFFFAAGPNLLRVVLLGMRAIRTRIQKYAFQTQFEETVRTGMANIRHRFGTQLHDDRLG